MMYENFGTEEHRIINADCLEYLKTLPSDSVDLLVTDPPYGVDYGAKNEFLNTMDKGNRIQTDIENDSKTPQEMYAFWLPIFKECNRVLKAGAGYYCFSPQGGELMWMLQKAILDSGLLLKQQLIWVKNNHVLGRMDYNFMHEPIFYGWKEGAAHKYYGRAKRSVWFCDRPTVSKLHPTQKPLPLIVEALQNSSLEGDVVLDPFLGSGTTIVAAKMLGRKGIGVELDKNYCEVSKKRLLNVPNKLEDFLKANDI